MINMSRNKINIVIPMAGLGSRFASAGYNKPKPFIDVNGKPMIIRVIENLFTEDSNIILIAQRSHGDKEKSIVKEIEDKFKAKFIFIDGLTEGTACSVLFAEKFINNKLPLIIANSDQIVDFDVVEFVENNHLSKLDGSILTFIDPEKNPKWSFAKVDKNNKVIEVKEKEVISDFATVGIYLFSKGSDFIKYAKEMINNDDRVNNEFYTCPVYNYAIRDKRHIGIYNIPYYSMHGLGTPEDLKKFILKKEK